MIQQSTLYINSRAMRSLTGPYGAPYLDGLDPRWSTEGFLYLVTTWPACLPWLWNTMRDTWDQGARQLGQPNPYWIPPPEGGDQP